MKKLSYYRHVYCFILETSVSQVEHSAAVYVCVRVCVCVCMCVFKHSLTLGNWISPLGQHLVDDDGVGFANQ